MNRVVIFALIITLFVFCSYNNVYAKEFMYMFTMGPGYITKIDSETGNTVLNSQLTGVDFVQEGDSSVYVANNKIFVVNGKHSINILVYDLSTLKKIKTLDIQTPHPEVIMFATPDEKRIFIVWWNTKLDEGAWQFDVYDTNSLERMTTLDYYFWPKDITFSPDGMTLYSIDNGEDIISKFDLNSYKILGKIDYQMIGESGFKARHARDHKNGKVLMSNYKMNSEGEKLFSFFAYDLITNTSSVQTPKDLSINMALAPDGNHVLVNREDTIRDSDGMYLYKKSLGLVDVYSVQTGSKMGSVNYKGGKHYKFIRFHPTKPHAYMLGWSDDKKYLIVLDYETLKIAKEIELTESGSFFYFHDEPDEAPTQ